MHLAEGNDRFLVLSVLNARAEVRGTLSYHKVLELNAALAGAFAGHFLDVRSYLVSKADPAVPQDLIDQANDIIPSSLRSDALHLNTAGSALVAAQIKEFFDALGW